MRTATHQDYRGPFYGQYIDHQASFEQKMSDTISAQHCELKDAGIPLVRDEEGSLSYKFPAASLVYPTTEA